MISYLDENGMTADVSDISFSNVIIKCEEYPIRIAVEDGIKLSRIAEISFSDMRINSLLPCVIKGNSETIIENVTFNNIRMKISGNDAITCSHCHGIKLNNIELDVIK